MKFVVCLHLVVGLCMGGFSHGTFRTDGLLKDGKGNQQNHLSTYEKRMVYQLKRAFSAPLGSSYGSKLFID